MNDIQNRIVGIVGRKGAGKSTCAATLIKYAPRVFVFDAMEEHQWLPDSFDGIDADLDEYFDETRHVKTFACAYAPGDDLEDDFEEICKLVFDYGRMLYVVEEAPLVLKPGYMPPVFGKIVRVGRHRQIDLLWTAQRAHEVSRTLTSATDVWVFFSQTEPRDLDSIAERCGREVAEMVAQLGIHDHFTYDVIAREVIPNSPRLLKREIPGA